ncbi:MAG: hypothetical protein K2I60_01265 [Oscillospiraceae bacterium]|nr:hypothetical protein [Oscillospiraceae bacterium]
MGEKAATTSSEPYLSTLNEFFVSKEAPWQMIMSLILGIAVAIAYKLDLPSLMEIKAQIPYVGCILTGILISRGSNYIYDLISKLAGV